MYRNKKNKCKCKLKVSLKIHYQFMKEIQFFAKDIDL